MNTIDKKIEEIEKKDFELLISVLPKIFKKEYEVSKTKSFSHCDAIVKIDDKTIGIEIKVHSHYHIRKNEKTIMLKRSKVEYILKEKIKNPLYFAFVEEDRKLFIYSIKDIANGLCGDWWKVRQKICNTDHYSESCYQDTWLLEQSKALRVIQY